MTPQSPVIPGVPEVVYGRDQPEYTQLPAIRLDDGSVLSRWRMSWMERIKVLFTGDVYLFMVTCDKPLQPVLITVSAPVIDVHA